MSENNQNDGGILNKAELEFTIQFVIGFFGWFLCISIYYVIFNSIAEYLGPLAIVLMYCIFIPAPVTFITFTVTLRAKNTTLGIGILTAVFSNALLHLVWNPSTPSDFFSLVSMYPFFLN